MSDTNILDAFAAALADMANLKPDAQSNRGGYVSLSALIAACRPILAKHGLSMTQDMRTTNGEVQVQTSVVGHGSKVSTGWYGLEPKGPGGQELLGAQKFVCRGQLQAFLGITGGDDDAVVPRGQVADLGAACQGQCKH